VEQRLLATYVQDNWRVNRRLTLNLGLRWDGVPHTYEANNRMGNFYPNLYDPAKAALLNPDGTINPASPGLGTSPNPILAGVPLYLNGIGIPGQNGVPKGLVDNHWAAFGPRIGFAYDLNGQGKTVVRGGAGMMYERIQGNDMYDAGPTFRSAYRLIPQRRSRWMILGSPCPVERPLRSRSIRPASPV